MDYQIFDIIYFMLKGKVFFLFTLLLFLSTSVSKSIMAKDPQIEINYEKINPDSVFYPLKRLWEKIQLRIFYRGEVKQKGFYIKLLDRRFKELIFVANEEKLDDFEKAASRYMTTAGYIIDNFKPLEDNHKDKIKYYSEILEKVSYAYEVDSSQWLFLRQSQDLTQKILVQH